MRDLCVARYAWEEPLKQQASKLRQEEGDSLRRTAVLKAINQAGFLSTTLLACAISFILAWLTRGELNADQVFPSLVLFASVSESIVFERR